MCLVSDRLGRFYFALELIGEDNQQRASFPRNEVFSEELFKARKIHQIFFFITVRCFTICFVSATSLLECNFYFSRLRQISQPIAVTSGEILQRSSETYSYSPIKNRKNVLCNSPLNTRRLSVERFEMFERVELKVSKRE